jgi:hypothetical protein
MSRNYANVALYGAHQRDVVFYLSRAGISSYVSPTINNLTIIYCQFFEDSFSLSPLQEVLKLHRAIRNMIPQSFSKLIDESFSEAVQKVQNENDQMYGIVQDYHDSIEAVLVYTASILSKYFSCPALAVLVKDRVDFWYHLNQDGTMVDEYTNSATSYWQPGSARGEDSGEEIKGGNALSLCQAFNCHTARNQIESILLKPDNPDSYRLLDMDYKSLLNLPSFPNAIIRHRTLAFALGMCPAWVTYMSFNRIREHLFDHVVGDTSAPTPEEMAVSIQKV